MRLRRLSVQLVFWFMVVALLPLTTAVTAIYYQRLHWRLKESDAKLVAMREMKVAQLERWVDRRLDDIRSFAASLQLHHLGEELHGTGEHSPRALRYAEIRRQLALYVSHYDEYRELYIIDSKTKRTLISTKPGREGIDRSKAPFFREAFRARKPYISQIYRSQREQIPVMEISMPILCEAHDGKHVTGVLAARVDLQRSLFRLLGERSGIGETGEFLLLNRQGLVLSEGRWDRDAPLKRRVGPELSRLAADKHAQVWEARDYRGRPVLVAHTWIQEPGWTLMVKQDLAELKAPITAMLRQMAVASGIVLVVVTIFALILARRLAKPIHEVAQVARQVQEGDVAARCGPAQTAELAEMARAINEMAEELGAQTRIQRAVVEINETMVAAASVPELATSLLAKLMALTASHCGAFYRRSREGRTFEPVISVGCSIEQLGAFDAVGLEGQLGQAVFTREISVLTEIDQTTAFRSKTIAGEILPRQILTIPLLAQDEVAGLISLASLHSFSDEHRAVLEQVWIGQSTALANLLATEETERVADALQVTNDKLVAANEELHARSEELERQAQQLRELADELEQQRRQVQQADRLKSEFLANMSHELRTPLNSVMALSQVMLARGPGKDPRQEAEFLTIIERNGRQLLNLINNILDLSKIEAGRAELELGQVDPQRVLLAAIQTVRPLIEEKRLELGVEGDQAPAFVSDEGKVQQILLNLLSNAAKFTDSGRIDVKVSASDTTVRFTVRDTGQGIASADLPAIFDEFRQVDGSATRRHGGTGLGLAISRRLAVLLGGAITAESEPGRGSAFTLELPLKPPTAAVGEPKRAPAEPPRTAGTGAGGRILVVEDNDIAALQVRSALESRGYAVERVASGAEAIERLDRQVPDGVVLDLMMPGIDGFQVLEQIRTNPRTEGLPVLVLTAKELIDDELRRLRKNNIRHLILKGTVDRDGLVAAADQLLGRRRLDAQVPGKPAEAWLPHPDAPVLVVEDNQDNLVAIDAVLDAMGTRHVAAHDGEEALRLARQLMPRLILMDLHLPVLSGLDAMRLIRADVELKEIPIVALTARAMKGDREQVLAAGFDDYLAKPIAPRDLQQSLEKWSATGAVARDAARRGRREDGDEDDPGR